MAGLRDWPYDSSTNRITFAVDRNVVDPRRFEPGKIAFLRGSGREAPGFRCANPQPWLALVRRCGHVLDDQPGWSLDHYSLVRHSNSPRAKSGSPPVLVPEYQISSSIGGPSQPALGPPSARESHVSSHACPAKLPRNPRRRCRIRRRRCESPLGETRRVIGWDGAYILV